MIGASPASIYKSRLCPLTSPKCTVSGFCGFATFHVNCFCTFSYVCVAGGADVRQRRPQPPHPGEDHPREERAPGGGQPRDTDGISRQHPWVTTWRRVITLVCCRWWRSRLSRSWSRARARPGSTASQTWTGSRTSSQSRQVPVYPVQWGTSETLHLGFLESFPYSDFVIIAGHIKQGK